MALLACAAVVACGRTTPSDVADLADVAAPAPAPISSRFSVPLDYDFTAVLRVVERVVPKTFGSMDSVRMAGNDARRHYAFAAERGPFTAFAAGNLLHLSATIEYTARGFYKPIVGPTIAAGCGGGPEKPRIVIEVATPITISADWRLVSHAQIVRIEPASTDPRDHCDVSILHRDVTEQVVAAARSGLASHLGDIDKKIAGVDFRSRVVGWWQLLARPIRLTDGVWLVLGPERLRIGRISGLDRLLVVPVSLDAHPRVVVETATPPVDSVALPPLAHDTIGNGFHIVIDGTVDYLTASQAITRSLGGKVVTIASRTITVNSVSVIPASHGRLVLAVTFTGDARGTMRLVGTPRYDARSGEVAVPDLDFDLKTNSDLINAYSWLKSDDLRATLREKARFPVGPVLDRGRTLLTDGLNRKIGDALTLSARVDTVAVQGLYVTRGGLIVRGEASGRANVSVKQR